MLPVLLSINSVNEVKKYILMMNLTLLICMDLNLMIMWKFRDIRDFEK
jgi:hypothetical protein